MSAKLTFHIPYALSLKDKRQVRRSLIDKTRQRFNVSVAEIDEQDTHQILVIGVAAISADTAQADSIIDNALNFIESNTEAETISLEREIR